MVELKNGNFDVATFLSSAGLGRKIVQLKSKQAFFSQGCPADSVFYLQKGRAKLTVVSKNGKEATITLCSAGDFVGEESLATVGGLHMATATAISACAALKIERKEMVRVMHEEHAFSDLFLAFLLGRSMRTQADLCRSAFQLQRKAFGENSFVDGGVWQAGRTGNLDSTSYAGNSGRYDRHDEVPRQLFHESLPQARLYSIQRAHPGSPP